MSLRSIVSIVAAVSASLLVTSTALADDDRVRFRGGVSAAGGVLVAPQSEVALGTAGVQGEVGVQFNDFIGVSWVPQIDLGLGSGIGGLNLSTAVLLDINPIDFITLGIGPDVGVFAAVGNDEAAAGANFGGRFRFAVHPLIIEGRHGRRSGLTVGADLRVLDGGTLASTRYDSRGFVFQPMLTLGYTAF